MASFLDYVPEGQIPEVSKDKVFMDYVPAEKPVKRPVDEVDMVEADPVEKKPSKRK